MSHNMMRSMADAGQVAAEHRRSEELTLADLCKWIVAVDSESVVEQYKKATGIHPDKNSVWFLITDRSIPTQKQQWEASISMNLSR